MESDFAIDTRKLTMYYGRHRGITDLDLSVRRGEVFGFLGPNGAGKTTTERILLDIIRPSSGTARVFGLDCRRSGVALRRQVGYLPGELKLYEHLTGERFLAVIASLHGQDVDYSYRKELCDRLEIDTKRKIGQYSRGNKQKIGIVSAFMAKPDLLLLDEPTLGLDPLKQQTVMELVREARFDGRTVFFSSHILQEVQSICDRVGIIREGRLIATERVEDLTRQHFKRLVLTLRDSPPPDAFALSGVTETGREGSRIHLTVRANLDTVMATAVRYGIVDIDTRPVTLEEVFLTFYGNGNGGRADE